MFKALALPYRYWTGIDQGVDTIIQGGVTPMLSNRHLILGRIKDGKGMTTGGMCRLSQSVKSVQILKIFS